ncbi:fatty-acid peroxygenase [Salsuginibacillus halophilus]|uniref:Fatty-acid peroxygenase n=1 Tax=Salsuginibacillus halophilus TaxID=517424 RepID=A0A2P8H983_9BACI|nr:cytochrome P450 [Salsuginibacillus halophilus]PSL42729.1 fatty-acid peroxygenase [Salsuginibacillus halophilus]
MKVKSPVPKAKGVDNTMALINEGFEFLRTRRQQLESDIFETRLLGKKTVCMGGAEAAEIFYDEEKFYRKNAVPKVLKKSLLGNGVHGMDGSAHKHRKQMFLSMMTPERLEAMKDIALEELDAKAQGWEKQQEVVLFDEMLEVLARSGCRWAGVPLKEDEVKQRTEEMARMVDSFGGSLDRLKEGKQARESQEKWLKGIIKDARAGRIEAPPYTPLYIIANHRDQNGKLLDAQTAGVELNNTIRPLLATAYFLVFGAMAMHEHPETVGKLREDENDYSHKFAQETRRFYPFAPAMAARVKKNFTWSGYDFKKDMLVVLDFFGTNRHPDDWEAPDEFRPERFEDWNGSPFSFIPQGGGDHYMGHRCAGEWTTVMVMRAFFRYFVRHLTYTVPKQDLSYSLSRMPTLPNSGFKIRHVRRVKFDVAEEQNVEQSQTVVKS